MNLVSLGFFILTIVLAFARKSNIGILALAIGAVAVRVFGLTDKDLINGISVSLFATLVGITLLFAIIKETGALDLMARKMIALAGNRMWLFPILIFVAGFTIVAAGPGGVPALAIIPPLAIAIALRVGYNPVMFALIGISGMTAGRFSPITPESAIIINAVSEAGLNSSVIPAIMMNVFIANLVVAVILFIVYKGYKVKAPEQTQGDITIEKFNAKQIIALCSIVVLLVLIIVVGMNIGIAAFLVASALLLINISDDAVCIKTIPWGTIVMVLGMGSLLSIVDKMGGISLMNDALASIMTEKTATPIMGVSAGLLSLVSSALGVVYPTMMPMCISISEQIGGVNPAALMSAVAAGGALSGISPMSTGGALILAAIAGAKKDFTKEEERKVFVQLLLIAIASLVILILVSWLFGPIANLLSPMN